MNSSSMHRFRVHKSQSAPARRRPHDRLYSSAAVVPACDRCRKLKKKCSKTLPQCKLCSDAGESCSLTTYTPDSAEKSRLLQDRVQWLQAYVKQHLPTIEDLPTGTDLTELAAANHVRPVSDTSSPVGASIPGESLAGHGDSSSCAAQAWTGPDADSTAGTPEKIQQDTTDAYFRHVHRSYPFIDRIQLLGSTRSGIDVANHRSGSESIILYLVRAIGFTTLQRAGRLPINTMVKFELKYMDIMQDSIAHESIESVQSLLLLALYSLFDPHGIPTHSILAVLARQALCLGISRRCSSLEGSLSVEAEIQHRLYWSIFALDRMMAVSVGLPYLMDDCNAEVPLPSVTVQEFASSERASVARDLQINRHVIQLRRIEGTILEEIHLRNREQASMMSQSDRKVISSKLRLELENWYSSGCLVSLPECDNIPIHNSLFWLNARYYHLLILLHYPCHFNAQCALISALELLSIVQKFVQCNAVLLQQKQLPLNRVTLFRMLPVCLVFVYCFAKIDTHPFPAWEEVESFTDMLATFSDKWEHAHRTETILRRFITSSQVTENPRIAPDGQHAPQETFPGTHRQSTAISIRDELTTLMRDAMGETCCYRFVEGWDENLDEHPNALPSELLQASQGSGQSADGTFNMEFW